MIGGIAVQVSIRCMRCGALPSSYLTKWYNSVRGTNPFDTITLYGLRLVRTLDCSACSWQSCVCYCDVRETYSWTAISLYTVHQGGSVYDN